MEIILLRHGQTAGNLAGRYIGKTDEPLCEEGISHVKKKGVFPDIPRVYVSGMLRAKQTASLLFPNAGQVVCEDLGEMDFGKFEGRSAPEMEHDSAYRDWVDSSCRDTCPDGESLAIFAKRICAAFERVIRDNIEKDITSKDIAETHDKTGEPINNRMVIVAHGGTIMAVMQKFARPAQDYFTWHVGNGQGWRAYLDENNWNTEPVLTSYEKLEVLDL